MTSAFQPSPLEPGDPVRAFTAPTSARPDFSFGSVAGRYVVLCFLHGLDEADIRLLGGLVAGPYRGLFDDRNVSFFGVSTDATLHAAAGLQDAVPGVRYFQDFEVGITRLYGMQAGRAGSLVLDPSLRVLATLPFEDVQSHLARLTECLAALPPVDDHAGVAMHAPVLIVPRVFEPEFCAELIGAYHQEGGVDSGFMQQIDGRTVGIIDHSFKRRSDVELALEDELRVATRRRIERRLLPEIRRAFSFHATRIERYLVACYDAGRGGFFRPHRDNTTKGTAHRQFAVTLNLNTGDYDGGDLRFPEFGGRTYRAPLGGAVVFSCSLLHEATPVTAGRRYAFLPFLYGEEAARIREQNAHLIAGGGLGAKVDTPAAVS